MGTKTDGFKALGGKGNPRWVAGTGIGGIDVAPGAASKVAVCWWRWVCWWLCWCWWWCISVRTAGDGEEVVPQRVTAVLSAADGARGGCIGEFKFGIGLWLDEAFRRSPNQSKNRKNIYSTFFRIKKSLTHRMMHPRDYAHAQTTAGKTGPKYPVRSTLTVVVTK